MWYLEGGSRIEDYSFFLERKKLDAQRKISTLCLLMNSPFPTKIFCKRMLVCYPIAFGNPSLRHMLVIPFSAIAEKLRSQLQNSPTKLVSLTLFASISRNFSITWEQHRRGFLFFCDNGKSPKGEKLYNIYLFRSFCVGEKSDSEVIRVTVNAKAVRRISIVKSFENGISVLENRGKFIYT